MKLCACLLASAVFLAPANQARIHVFTSLFKHVGFGGGSPRRWPGTRSRRGHAVPEVKQRGAAMTSAAWPWRACSSGHRWPRPISCPGRAPPQFAAQLSTILRAHKGHVLAADNGNVIEYYLPDELQRHDLRRAVVPPLPGPCYRDTSPGGRSTPSIKHGYFSLIARGGRGNDPRSTDRRPNHAHQIYGGYQIISTLPYQLLARVQLVPHLGSRGAGMTTNAAASRGRHRYPSWCCRSRRRRREGLVRLAIAAVPGNGAVELALCLIAAQVWFEVSYPILLAQFAAYTGSISSIRP